MASANNKSIMEDWSIEQYRLQGQSLNRGSGGHTLPESENIQ